MASLRSLGLHTPTGLQYLIAEHILPEAPSEEQYHWEIYDDDEAGDEEILVTDYCVVYSRGGLVQKVFRFEIEQQKVVQAILTWFPADDTPLFGRGHDHEFRQNVRGSNKPDASQSTAAQSRTSVEVESVSENALGQRSGQHTGDGFKTRRSRALVVFLKLQAHVFFLAGSTHVVNLPFEVERAFAAPRGLILQRKLPVAENIAPTPVLPQVPQNSFYSQSQSQSQFRTRLSSSFIGASQRLSSSFNVPRGSKGLRAASTNTQFLADLLRESKITTTDELPRLFSFTDPLSELGLVVTAPLRPTSSLTGNGASTGDFVSLDKAEEVLFVSKGSEVPGNSEVTDSPLIVVVTVNYDTAMYSVWYASYVEPRRVSSIRKRQPKPASNKIRRRSSYVPGTGTTTPGLRTRDGLRESMGGAAVRIKTVPTYAGTSKVKPSSGSQSVEEALASQLDPDYDLPGQPAKESRRVSSLLSRADLSTSFDKTAFQDLATQRTNLGTSFGAHGRRGHSYGGYNDRRGLDTYPVTKLRASTSGSMLRLSFGETSIDETSESHDMDGDTELFDIDDTLEDSLLDDLDNFALDEPIDGLKKEFVMLKFAEIPIGAQVSPLRFGPQQERHPSQGRNPFKVFTAVSPFSDSDPSNLGHRFFLHIVRKDVQEHIELEFVVRRTHPSTGISLPDTSNRPIRNNTSLIPIPVRSQRFKNHLDAISIADGAASRVLCLKQAAAGDLALWLYASWAHVPPLRFELPQLRILDPHFLIESTSPARKIAGLQRTLSVPRQLCSLLNVGEGGVFDVEDNESRKHRLQFKLSPRNSHVSRCLKVCQFILPTTASELLLNMWWTVYRSFNSHHIVDLEWTAFVVTLFAVTHVSTSNDQTNVRLSEQVRSAKSRTSSQPARSDTAWDLMWKSEAQRFGSGSSSSPAWEWAKHAIRPTRPQVPSSNRLTNTQPFGIGSKSDFITSCASQARSFLQTPEGQAATEQWNRLRVPNNQSPHLTSLSVLLLGLHLLREERKLSILEPANSEISTGNLGPVLAQLGRWMGWDGWDWRLGGYYDLDGTGASRWIFEDLSVPGATSIPAPWAKPPSIYEWLEQCVSPRPCTSFPMLDMVAQCLRNPSATITNPPDAQLETHLTKLTPRTVALSRYFIKLTGTEYSETMAAEVMLECGIDARMIETLPEAIAAPCRETIARCQADPPTTWNSALLELINRKDLNLFSEQHREGTPDLQPASAFTTTVVRDIHAICQATEQPDPVQSTPEADRFMVTRLIFSEDRRFSEAARLLEPLRPAVAECVPDPAWSEAEYLDAQKAVMQLVMIRTFALPPGQSMLYFDSKKPLLTEKYPLHGFNTVCVMKPMNNTVTADRSNFTEEKYCWAFFHAGVTAGLSISKRAEGIDTSWIVFNKPSELSNKHAGLLLALGLNGHLRTIAKWLSFKYLTPKHNMTSIGLLLGLSASYLGTMDALVTRLLSVHVTRMLPPGAADLNLPPLTQTSGLMGIGLLYSNTQHRRMSEVMLSELEHVEIEDPSGPPDTLRDEGYRLAAGFALGFINLGKGKDLRGLHDMRLVDRLLAVAIGPKPVDVVHILDRATTGAIIAIALIFMKTQNDAVARKIDIPDTLPQFDYVRPDTFLLRTLAKHMILWDDIQAEHRWIVKNLPIEYKDIYLLREIKMLRSEHMPFFNILAGLLWSVGLRHAGSGDMKVRDFLVRYLDQFIRIAHLPAIRYDARLTRNTVRNCQDLVTISAAVVMAGTGDLDVFRRLRLLHGRINPDTPYGSHMAAHLALGVLFLGGGTYTLSTSNLAIASLICAFYPLFPMDVLDNKAHLQAFRHFWVLAAEPRCIIVRDVDTHRAISSPITLSLKDGTEKALTAPCLLPPLDTIAQIRTASPEHWPLTLDFAHNAAHLAAFRLNQTVHVRRRPASEAHGPVFSTTLAALNDAQASHTARAMWDWIFRLPAFTSRSSQKPSAASSPSPQPPWIDQSEIGLIIPADVHSSVHLDMRGTVVDDRLALKMRMGAVDMDSLWQLRILFKWAEEAMARGDGRLAWLGREVVEGLRALVAERARRFQEGE